MAELLSYSGERGVAGDSGYGEQRRRWSSAVRGRERGRSRGRVRASRGDRDGLRTSSTRPGGRGKQEVAARPCAREHAAASGRGEEDDGGLQCWAGSVAGWAGQLAGPHREEPR